MSTPPRDPVPVPRRTGLAPLSQQRYAESVIDAGPQPAAPLSPGRALSILRRRWPVLAIAVLILLGVAMVTAAVKPKMYASSAEVLLQGPEQGGFQSMSSQFAGLAALVGLPSAGDIETQIEVMTSDSALAEVSTRAHLHVPPDKLRMQISVAPHKTAGNVVVVSAVDSSPKRAALLVSTLIKVYEERLGAQDNSVVGRTYAKVKAQLQRVQHQLAAAESNYAKYSQNVGSVAPDVENTQRVQQMYNLNNEYLAAQRDYSAAAAQRDYYKSQVAALPTSIVPNVTFSQNPQIEQAKTELRSLEEERTRLSAQFTPADEEMKQNAIRINSAKQRIVQLRVAERGLLAPSQSGAIAVNPNGNDIVELGGSRTLNPLREDSRSRLVAAQAAMEASATQAAALRRSIGASKNDVRAAPRTQRGLADLKEEVTIQQKLYESLRAQTADLETRRSAERTYLRTLQAPSVNRIPVSPKPALFAGLAIALGLMIGTILMVLLDQSDPHMHSRDDVVRITGLPVLETVPRLGLKADKSLVFALDDVVPSYRRLAATLSYLGVGRSVRSLVVTSTVSGEGVTFTASHLAAALAREGRRVILIDANVRNPGVHTFFGAHNTEGLPGLMQNGMQPDKALVPVESLRPLRIIPGGTIGDAAVPPELLHPDKLGLLLGNLKDLADVVLIDAPAIFDGLETAALADKADGVLLVSALHTVDREEIERAIALLARCAAETLGVVINDRTSTSVAKS